MIKFGTLVRIKRGFYEGCKGISVDCNAEYRIYGVEISKIIGNEVRTKTIEVEETNLEVVK